MWVQVEMEVIVYSKQMDHEITVVAEGDVKEDEMGLFMDEIIIYDDKGNNLEHKCPVLYKQIMDNADQLIIEEIFNAYTTL